MTEILTAAGLILTVLLAYMQIQKQHHAGVRLQREHLRDKLRVEIYERTSASAHDAARCVGRAGTSAMSIVSALKLRAEHPVWPLSTTAEEMSEAHFAAARAITDVLVALEQYEIAFLRFGSIRRAFAEEHKHLLEDFTALGSEFSKFLPHQVPGDDSGAAIGPLAQPTPEQFAALVELKDGYVTRCHDISAYVSDLQVELQNELLGHLFEGRVVPHRQPEDENAVVLKRDASDPTERPKGRWV